MSEDGVRGLSAQATEAACAPLARRVLALLALVLAAGLVACDALPGDTRRADATPVATPPPVAVATPPPSPTPTPTATPGPVVTPTPGATPTATAVAVVPEQQRGAAVAVVISDPVERARIEAALAAADGFVAAVPEGRVQWAISDRPLDGSRTLVLARWAAITDQRRDVLDISRDHVIHILRGEIRNWFQLGGSRQPIRAYLPASQAALIVGALGLAPGDLAAELIPDEELAGRVAGTPGAFALIEPEQLRLGVLALTVDGHDPYRDSARESPLSAVRWLRAPGLGDVVKLAAAAGLEDAAPFDPAGMLVTGELIPVRCTNYVLAQLDDYGAMFDGVREAIEATDIAVASLESSLTALSEPTPCVETFLLQGSHRAIPAIADAGLDVLFTIGNHMLDCWEDCSGAPALLDTLRRLDEAGVESAGAGETLSDARSPAILRVHTAHGFVRFAFLGYDSVAPWYTSDRPRSGRRAARRRDRARGRARGGRPRGSRRGWCELGRRVHGGPHGRAARDRWDRDRLRRLAGDRQPPALGAGGRALRRRPRGLLVGQLRLRPGLVGGDDAGDGDGTGVHARAADRLPHPPGRDPRR